MSIQDNIPQEDLDLEYTRGIRRKMIDKLTENNQLPTEAKDVAVLAGVLSDVDRSAIAIKRLKADDKNNKDNRESAALIAKMLSQFSGKDMKPQVSGERTSVPQLPADLEPPELVEGHTDKDPGNETYSEFQKRMAAREED